MPEIAKDSNSSSPTTGTDNKWSKNKNAKPTNNPKNNSTISKLSKSTNTENNWNKKKPIDSPKCKSPTKTSINNNSTKNSIVKLSKENSIKKKDSTIFSMSLATISTPKIL